MACLVSFLVSTGLGNPIQPTSQLLPLLVWRRSPTRVRQVTPKMQASVQAPGKPPSAVADRPPRRYDEETTGELSVTLRPVITHLHAATPAIYSSSCQRGTWECGGFALESPNRSMTNHQMDVWMDGMQDRPAGLPAITPLGCVGVMLPRFPPPPHPVLHPARLW